MKIKRGFDGIDVIYHWSVSLTPHQVHTTSLLQLDVRINDHDDG
jgi:hypothetical protein